MTDVRRLCWGPRVSSTPGWIYADNQEGPGIDIASDIVLDGLPFETDSVDYISSQHALQKLEVYHLWTALEELHRILKPGGLLRLGLPDLDQALSAYLNGRRDHLWCSEWDTLTGNLVTQLTGNGTRRSFLNFEFAEELLRKCGYTNIRRLEYGQTRGPFPEIVELDQVPGESFYVEAFKPSWSPEGTMVAAGPAHQIHLSWSEDPSHSFTVVWQTPLGNSPNYVEFRVAGTDQWQRLAATTRLSPGAGKLHQAVVRNLSEAAEYEYRVSGDEGAQQPASEVFRTRTAPGSGSGNFTFAFLCDTGISGRQDGNATGIRPIIEELLKARPLFILGGGDYAYSNSDGRYPTVHQAIDAWFLQMEPVLARTPFMAQYGNHEIYLRERLRDWAPRFAFPPGFDSGRNYAFDVGAVHFTALFVPGPRISPAQLLWLNTDLAQARSRGKSWLIVYQHEPIYGHGASHPGHPEVRRTLAPVFEKHRVDLHLSGHDQNYERTFPLLDSAENPKPSTLSLSDYRAGEGVIYAKVSPGGKMSEKGNHFSKFTAARQTFIARRDDTAHHYALIHVRGNSSMTVEVYRVTGEGKPGTLFDSFKIESNRACEDGRSRASSAGKQEN